MQSSTPGISTSPGLAHASMNFQARDGRTVLVGCRTQFCHLSSSLKPSRARSHHRRTDAPRGRTMCSALTASPDVAQKEYTWTGVDEFSALRDRVDAPPLPLPSIKQAKRVVLVRHGQSTWNAEGRIQGSSNISVLTEKGEAQAETTRQMVSASFKLHQGPNTVASLLTSLDLTLLVLPSPSS